MIGMDAPHLSGESVVCDERGQLFDQPLAAPFSGSRSEPDWDQSSLQSANQVSHGAAWPPLLVPPGQVHALLGFCPQ